MGDKSTRSYNRNGRDDSACGSWKRIPRIKSAEIKNEPAFITNTAFRPSNAPTTPPKVAPSTRFMDQVVDDSVLARTRSSRVVILGITELRAGSKNAAIMVSSRRSEERRVGKECRAGMVAG